MFEDYIAGKCEAGAKEAVKLRLEGKEYVVHEGDVMHYADVRIMPTSRALPQSEAENELARSA